MSLTAVRPYFQAAMKRAFPESVEWDDAFNEENIPSTILDKAWHFNFIGATVIDFNQVKCIKWNYDLEIIAWTKGFKTSSDAIDYGVKKVEAIIGESCRHTVRLSQAAIKNVIPQGVSAEALSDTNDNIAKMRLSFRCLVVTEVDY